MTQSLHSHLYLMHHRTEPRFKVGKADCPAERASALGLFGQIDAARSCQVALELPRVFEIERFLHRTLADHSLDLPRSDGSTEWFHADAHEKAMRVIAFLASEENAQVEPLDLSSLRARRVRRKLAASEPDSEGCPRAAGRIRHIRVGMQESLALFERCAGMTGIVVELADKTRIIYEANGKQACEMLDRLIEIPDGLVFGLVSCRGVGELVNLRWCGTRHRGNRQTGIVDIGHEPTDLFLARSSSRSFKRLRRGVVSLLLHRLGPDLERISEADYKRLRERALVRLNAGADATAATPNLALSET